MPPRAKKSDIKDEDWEKFQPIIRRLYLTEDKSLKDLLTILSMSHGFRPSKAQLEWKLTQWRMTKKMIASEWKYVHHRIRNRRAVGKESSVYLSGVQLRDVTIEKAKVRHCYETALEKSMGVVVPPSPTDLSLIIRTPSPQRDPELDNMNGIPWLTARNLIKDFNVSLSGRVGKHFQFPGDRLLMLAMERPIVQTNHTARLQSTFEALSLIMPEQLQQDHVYHAESLLLSSKNGSNITGALQMMLFLLSNNFLDSYHGEHNRIIEALLDVLPETDGWAALMSQQYTEFPVSIQSALDSLFKQAISRSNLDLVRSLVRVGVDANQALPGILNHYNIWRAVTAFEYAIFMNNYPLIQLLIEVDANRPSSNLELIQSAWEYRNSPHTTLESMELLLSNFVFCREDDEEACRLLEEAASVEACSIAEQIFEFFRTRLRTPASRSQLLTSAIRAHSRVVQDLLSEDQEHVSTYINHQTSKTKATPIAAAIYVGDIKLLERLLELGASLDPPTSGFTSCSLLQYAAYMSDADMLQKMLWHGADLNYCHPSSSRFTWPPKYLRVEGLDHVCYGKTALHSALLGGRADNAILLLEAGANLVGSELAIAIASCQNTVVGKLLTNGASFTETSTTSGILTVLEAAVLTEDMALISQTIKDSPQAVISFSLLAAIFVAESTSDLSIFKLLLGHISDTSQSEDPWLGTAMCLAAIFGDFEIVELMLASGLRPEKCLIALHDLTHDFNTRSLGYGVLEVPDNYLLWRQHISIIHTGDYKRHDLLETALSLVNDRGVDFFILLRQHGYHRIVPCPDFEKCPSLEVLQTLQSFGVEMTWRILSNSITDRCYNVTEWLLASDVNVNPSSKDPRDIGEYGDTPIQCAAYDGNLPLVETLMKLGADINAPGCDGGATALQYASTEGYFGLVRRLLEFQADPNALTPRGGKRGVTVLEDAAQFGKLDVVQLLLNSGVQTVGSGRFQYVRAIRLAQEAGYHAVARLIKSHRPWEEADQRLYDDKNRLDDDTEESDDGIGGETEDEYKSSEADFESSGVPCEVSGEKFEVDDENGDPSTDFGEDKDFSDYHSMMPDGIKVRPAYGINERIERPGDQIWAETYDMFSSELPWLM